MATKKKQPRRRAPREIEPPIPTPVEIVHRLIAVFDADLHSEDSGPRYSSRGKLIWEREEHFGDLNELWELRKFFMDILDERALEKAVARRLEEMGVTPKAKLTSIPAKGGRR